MQRKWNWGQLKQHDLFGRWANSDISARCMEWQWRASFVHRAITSMMLNNKIHHWFISTADALTQGFQTAPISPPPSDEPRICQTQHSTKLFPVHSHNPASPLKMMLTSRAVARCETIPYPSPSCKTANNSYHGLCFFLC